MTIQIRAVSPFHPDVLELIDQLNQHNLAIYSSEVCYLDPPEVLARENCVMLGVFDGEELCGIGAVKLFQTYGEIKRMFVAPKHRGKGLSQLILDQLIGIIRRSGLNSAKLETGLKLEAAVQLYRKNGFQICGPFGDYDRGDPNIYMEKDLT